MRPPIATIVSVMDGREEPPASQPRRKSMPVGFARLATLRAAWTSPPEPRPAPALPPSARDLRDRRGAALRSARARSVLGADDPVLELERRERPLPPHPGRRGGSTELAFALRLIRASSGEGTWLLKDPMPHLEAAATLRLPSGDGAGVRGFRPHARPRGTGPAGQAGARTSRSDSSSPCPEPTSCANCCCASLKRLPGRAPGREWR